MTSTVTYGVPTDDSGMAIRYGVERGVFAKLGIELTLRTIHGGPELAAALDRGEITIGQLGSPPAITAIGQEKRLRIIASSVERGAAFFLVVRKDLTDWNDLSGRVAGALSRGSCGYWFLRQILQQHELDPDSEVQIRALGADYGRQVDLLESGSIDLILATEPFVTLAEERGVGTCWGSVQDVGNVASIQWIVEVANTAFIAKEPALVDAVLDGIAEAARLALSDLDQWAEYWASTFNVSQEAAKRAIERQLPFLHAGGDLDRKGLENALALQHSLGATDRLLRFDDVVDARFQGQEAAVES